MQSPTSCIWSHKGCIDRALMGFILLRFVFASNIIHSRKSI